MQGYYLVPAVKFSSDTTEQALTLVAQVLTIFPRLRTNSISIFFTHFQYINSLFLSVFASAPEHTK
jgi:hypothetical protein